MTYSYENALEIMVKLGLIENGLSEDDDIDFSSINPHFCVKTQEPVENFIINGSTGIAIDGIELHKLRDFQSKKGAVRSDLYVADFGDFRIIHHTSH